jgi:hypothetical protein
MPSLINYTKHIAAQKVYIEVYGRLIRNIDEKFVKLKNISVISSLMNSKKDKSNQIEEIEDMFSKGINTFKHIQIDMESKLSFEEFKLNLLNDIQISLDKRLSYMADLCENRIDEFFLKLMQKNSEQLGMIKNRTMDIDLPVSNKVINEELEIIVENFLKALNIELDEKQKQIKEAESKMKTLVQTFSDIVRKEYNLKDFSINIPKIEQVYKKLLVVKLPETYIINSMVKEKLIDSIETQGNVIGKLANYFMRNRYGHYSVNSRQLESIKSEYIESIKNNINTQYYSSYNILRANLLAYLDEFKVKIDESFKDINDTYQSIITDVLGNLTDSKTNIENQLTYLDSKLQFFNEVDKITKDFIDQWNVVRDSAG